jgi:hypothetical protein
VETLSRRGRVARALVTAVTGVLVLAGTVWGTDDDFPFGPFLMYSSAPDPDADAPDTRVEGVDADGRVVVMTEGNSGLRRAEIEGQQQQYIDDPQRLAKVASAYHDRTPGAPPLTEVRIVIRWVGVEDSRPTGTTSDEVIARWTAS